MSIRVVNYMQSKKKEEKESERMSNINRFIEDEKEMNKSISTVQWRLRAD